MYEHGLKKTLRLISQRDRMNRNNLKTAKQWNDKYPVGTLVEYYPIAGEDYHVLTRTRNRAWTLGSGQVIVSVEGHMGGVNIEHLKVVENIENELEQMEKEHEAKPVQSNCKG